MIPYFMLLMVCLLFLDNSYSQDLISTPLNMRISATQANAASTAPTYLFYVALNGNDQWSGRLNAPNAAHTDGPFATMQRARDAIRILKRDQGGTLKQPITALVREGVYYLPKPLDFSVQDSGTAQCPITYAAYPNEKPVISGGRRLEDGRTVTVNGRSMWSFDIPEVKQGKWSFQQLWVNGERRFRARNPNQGYFHVWKEPDATPDTRYDSGQKRFQYSPGEITIWKNLSDVEVVLLHFWLCERLPIESVDDQNHIVNFSKKSICRIYDQTGGSTGDRYYVENALELLDSPGEWYLDRKSGILYYMPMPGESMAQTSVVAPVLSQLIQLNGAPGYIPTSQLVANNWGQMKNNYNFTGWTYVDGEGWESNNCFEKRGDEILLSEEMIPVNPNQTYRISGYLRSKGEGGLSKTYMGLACFDKDNKLIETKNFYQPNSTQTTLAKDLKDGDTLVYLQSVQNWSDEIDNSKRFLAVFDDPDYRPFGDYYYTRKVVAYQPGIDPNQRTLVLTSPWNQGNIPSGTRVSNTQNAGRYQYSLAFNYEIPSTWTYREAFIEGTLSNQKIEYSQFPPGTAAVKLVTFANDQQNDQLVMQIDGLSLEAVEKDPEQNPIEYLSFQNWSFQHTDYLLPVWISNSLQSAELVPGAIYGYRVKNCTIDHCTFTHLGGFGVEWGKGCNQNKVVRSVMKDLGAGGIKIGPMKIPTDPQDYTSANEVVDCRIYELGKFYPEGVGIVVGQSSNNLITHNEIHDLYYSGISVGRTWGYGASLGKNNIVEYNHIYNVGMGVLNDLGGIYTLGLSDGTKIHHNLIHDVSGSLSKGWGIYLDEGTTHLLVENNVIYRAENGSIHVHYGKENVVRNNILVNSTTWQIQRTLEEKHKTLDFFGNIVYFTKGTLLGLNWYNNQFFFNKNLYWNPNNPSIIFVGKSFQQWKINGQDIDSRIADPLFVNPGAGDYSLRPGSPAFNLGFQPIDLSQVGPRS